MKKFAAIGLSSLVCLFLAGCSGLNMLPDALNDPQNATILRIQNKRMDSLPKEIGQLTQLKTLYLFRNKLQYIPGEPYPVESGILRSHQDT